MTAQTMTKAQYGAHIGKSKQWVSQLDKQGRLVKNKAGLILVEESDAMINETADLSKLGVVARHEREREEKASQTAQPIIVDVVDENSPQFEQEVSANSKAGSVYQQSKAIREKYNALAAKLEYEKMTGKLLEVSDVTRVLYQAAATLRARLESYPDRYAVLFAAERSPERIKSELTESIEHLLTDLSKEFKQLSLS